MDAQPPLPPREALEAWVGRWPLPPGPRFHADLLPHAQERFWALLGAMSIRNDRAAAAHLADSQRLAEEEPQCATAWTVLGDHLYRGLWVNPDLAGIGLNSRTHRAFQRATELVPGHPRATFLWSLMLTDTGNQDLALQALGEAARLRPNAPDLYQGFAYAGRTAGLLDGAQRALARRKALLGLLASPSAWFAETTHLYLGDQEAFDEELRGIRAVRTDASILFYQGYAALLKGHRGQALALLKEGAGAAEGPDPFRNLCLAYVAALEDRAGEGLALLRRLDDVRGKLRIPDGEWTFKEAEAYALLGDADRAMDCATRAFVQGFSCARWYETSPFLERMRTHPRWPTLRRNVRERQAVLAGSYPASAFAP
jgi:tetratricopeptide (TPR) repeat protein